MQQKQVIGTRYLYRFFDREESTPSRKNNILLLVPIGKNKKSLFNLKISKGLISFNFFNIKTDCKDIVAVLNIYNISTVHQPFLIRGVLFLLKRSLSVPSTYRILGGISCV